MSSHSGHDKTACWHFKRGTFNYLESVENYLTTVFSNVHYYLLATNSDYLHTLYLLIYPFLAMLLPMSF